MCGLAGRMAMELGLHSADVPRYILESGHERKDIANILCSVIILDRQWSSASGLPTHFQESSFDKGLIATVSESAASLCPDTDFFPP